MPDSVSFDEAATLPLGLDTAAIGIYAEPRNAPGQGGGAGLVAPWLEEGVGKYAGKPAVVLGGSTSVGQFGSLVAYLMMWAVLIIQRSSTVVETVWVQSYLHYCGQTQRRILQERRCDACDRLS